MEQNTNYKRRINFQSESTDLTRQCCSYLKDKDYYYKDLEDNIILLEEALFNYSAAKLINWDISEQTVPLDNLENVCRLINEVIPSDRERQDFFIQYVHCIIYVIGALNRQLRQIDWLFDDSLVDTIDIEVNKNEITKIKASKDIPIYQLPQKLLERIRNHYNLKEKSLILNK